MRFHRGPFAIEAAVVNRRALVTVGHGEALAQDALLDRPDALQRPLRSLVAEISLELNAETVQRLKGVAKKKVLAFSVNAGALAVDGVPSAADF
jgi:hypothetical protein